jgi:hypothetical protein
MRKVFLVATFTVLLALLMAAPAFANVHINRNPFFNDHFFNGNGFNDNGVSQQNEQDVQSGDASQSINVTGGGDNSNQCAGVQGVTNTGNASNNTGVLQATPSNNNGFSDGNNRFNDNRFNNNGFNGSRGGEVQVDNSGDFTINPTSTTRCDQQVNQAATAAG